MASILLITYRYPPNTSPAAQRPFFFKKYSQHSITILTSTAAIAQEEAVYRTQSSGLAEGAVVAVGQKKQTKLYRLLKKFSIPDKGIVWYRSAYQAALRILKEHRDISVIVSTSPSVVTHLLAIRLKKRFDLRWIADYRDFYYKNAIELHDFLMRKPLDRLIERKLIGAADMHTFISSGMREAYIRAYSALTHNNTSVIPNGYDDKEFTRLKERKNSSRRLKILYAGSFYGGKRSPVPLLLILDHLMFDSDQLLVDEVEVLIAGQYDEVAAEQMKAFKSNVCVKWLGPLPRKETLHLMLDADLLWLITANYPDHYLGVPLKAFEYMGSRTPVVSFGPDMAAVKSIIDETNTGIHLDPDAIEYSLSTASQKVLTLLREGVIIDDAALAQYRRVNQALMLDEIINDIIIQ